MHIQSQVPTTAIRDHFLADHRSLDALLEELIGAFEANDRECVARLWTTFEMRLVAHMDAEERFLIPALLRVREADGLALLEDHDKIRRRLWELSMGWAPNRERAALP